jgi:hypothetical protein
MCYYQFCLDPTFDIEAEIVAAGVGSVTSDGTGFDISNVYEPGASTSSSSGIVLFLSYGCIQWVPKLCSVSIEWILLILYYIFALYHNNIQF